MVEHKCNSCFYMQHERDKHPCNTCEGYNKYVNRNIYINKPDIVAMQEWEDEAYDGYYGGSEDYVESVHSPAERKLEDSIFSPKHYTSGKYEVIDVIEDWDLNFRLANTIKYIARHKHKGKPLEDLKKALWYLQREIDWHESNS